MNAPVNQQEPALFDADLGDTVSTLGAADEVDRQRENGARLHKVSDRAKPRKGKAFYLALLSALAVTAVGLVYLKRSPMAVSAKPANLTAPGQALPGPLEATVAPREVDPKAPAAALPGTAPADSPGVDAAASSAAVPADLAHSFASIKALEARLDDLNKQVGAMSDDIKSLLGGSAQIKEQFAQVAERGRAPAAAVIVHARPTATRAVALRVAAPANSASTPPTLGVSTQLVAVDTWNGIPSVAVSDGTQLHFLAPGDSTPKGLVVKSANPSAQEVTFTTPSGENVVARVDTRKQ